MTSFLPNTIFLSISSALNPIMVLLMENSLLG